MSQLGNFDSYIEGTMQSWHCPGVAVAIIKGGEVLHRQAYGFRDIEAQSPMTLDTRFPVASVTKSFTAMSIALLIDEGKLEWDQPVGEVIPELILSDPYATAHMTVRDMLSHRTGLPGHFFAQHRLDITLAEFIKRMRYLKFSTSFRAKYQYSNPVYNAVAYLIEKLSGQAWEEFMHERIFAPLGMTASNFVPEPPVKGQLNAKGYRIERDDEGNVTGIHQRPFGKHTKLSPGTAGALFSTLTDLTKWLEVHINGGQANGFRLVSEDNLKQMHLPQVVLPTDGMIEALFNNTIATYGMGWIIVPHKGHTLIQHSGGVEGHSVIIAFIPEKRISLVILSNLATSPVPGILLYEGIDRSLNLGTQDWSTKFHKIVDPTLSAEAKTRQTTTKESIDAPASHTLETYVGTYEAKGYPDFAVKQEGDELQACTLGSLEWSALRHCHYNIFEWFLADFDFSLKVSFLANNDGELDSVSIPIEPAIDNIIFKRKALELPQTIINAVVGQYDPPLEGVTYNVTQKQGKIFFAETGGVAEEITACLLTDERIGFKMRDTRLDFVREKDAITQVILKSPFRTLEASRII